MAATPSELHSSPADEHSASDLAGKTLPGSDSLPASSGRRAEQSPHSDTVVNWVLFNLLIPIAIISLAAGAVIALGTVSSSQLPSADTSMAGRMQALMPVRVEAIKSLDEVGQRVQLTVDGTVVPFREVQIATEVAGQIIFKSDRCEAGAYVNEGDLLMKIDPTDYELEAMRLTRLQEQEYEALGEVDQEMVNTKRLIELAKQDETLQQREVQRLRSMPSGFASEGEIDRAARALLQATQQRTNSENQLDLLKQKRSRLEASERLAAAQLEVAKVNIARTEIRSPINGVIVSEQAERNTFVARGNPIVTIEDTTKVEVLSNLRMDQLYWVLDQKERSENGDVTQTLKQRGYEIPETPAIVEFEIAGRESMTYRWDARLTSYDGIGLDPATRTVPVRIIVDNPRSFHSGQGTRTSAGPTTLVRGMYVRVRLLIDPQTPLVVIPAEAIRPGNRVWHFMPDDSVLDLPLAGGLDVTAAAAVEPEATDLVSSTVADNFDPSKWQAGRLVMKENIHPIDSLSVGADLIEKRSGESPAETSIFQVTKKWWVCEVQDETITPGDFLAVSPISSADQGQFPARMMRPANTTASSSSLKREEQ